MKAMIEIPMKSRCKYEVEPKSGLLAVDRMLHIAYPANYGFIPGTLADDGDALDVFVICSEPLAPLSLVEIETHAMYAMKDAGVLDEKLIAVVKGDNVPESFIKKGVEFIGEFLKQYKKGTEVPMPTFDKAIIENTIAKYSK